MLTEAGVRLMPNTPHCQSRCILTHIIPEAGEALLLDINMQVSLINCNCTHPAATILVAPRPREVTELRSKLQETLIF